MVLAHTPHLLSLPSVCGKNFSQRITLIREVRKCRNEIKGDQKIIVYLLGKDKAL